MITSKKWNQYEYCVLDDEYLEISDGIFPATTNGSKTKYTIVKIDQTSLFISIYSIITKFFLNTHESINCTITPSLIPVY